MGDLLDVCKNFSYITPRGDTAKRKQSLMARKEVKGSDELLRAQTQLWSHIFNHIDSMALKCAVELGIPDAIAGLGSSVTIPELISALSLSPSKTPHMHRLMRVLTNSGIFACSRSGNRGEDAYSLTPLSELLVANRAGVCLSGFLRAMFHPYLLDSSRSMSVWFRDNDEGTPFSTANGCGIWDMTERDPMFNRAFSEGMASDARFLMDVLLKKCGRVFHGLDSLVDVGGGTGSTAAMIAEAFPDVKCSVLDLPQVVDSIDGKGNIEFVAGDMFDYVPPANAVLLKWILHAFEDEDCVKILGRCKEAIPSREEGGKVIIIDLVVAGNDDADKKSLTTQLYWDVVVMQGGGIERGEEEWKKVFKEAGFSDYKITPVGLRSVIELYP